jgi:hypothetical protein
VLDGCGRAERHLKSLHFAEVAQYFNTLSIPRGAYAARAMGEGRWRTLGAAQRAILTEGCGGMGARARVATSRRRDRR